MSLILEALKKSEAERRLGQAPTLTTSTDPTFARRSGRARLIAMATFALIAMLVALVALRMLVDRHSLGAPTEAVHEAPRLGSATDATDAPASVSSAPGRGLGSSAAVSDAVPGSEPTRRQLPAARPPMPATVSAADEVEAVLPRSVEFDSVERESMPVPAARDARPEPDWGDRKAAPAPRPLITATPSSGTAGTAPPGDEGSPSAPSAEADWVRVEYLPTQERNALPPLKVSMHVFAEIPSARFVLIDGRRLIEGDRIDQSLRVIEIRREGTVLDHQGRRLLLARP